jgi:hypothetical protein
MHRLVVVGLCAASVFAANSSGQAQNPAASPVPLASSQSAASPTPAPSATASPNTPTAQPAIQIANSGPDPLRVPAGTVLTFHLQTRLRPIADDPLDALPQGTVLHVKVLRPIDSTVDRDGSEFHGWVTSDLSLGDGVVIHADSQVRGLLVLLRSRNHPNGFRYELLLTELTDSDGKSYPLTASLSASFFDAPPASAATKVAAQDSSKPGAPSNTKIPVDLHQ